MGPLASFAVTILATETDSNELDLREYQIVGIQIGTITGATFSFKGRASTKQSKVAVVDNAGNVVSVTATDDRFIVFDEEPMRNLGAVPFLTFVSAGAEAEDRTIHVVARRCL